jgi:short-subunit dehydrogenase
MISLKNKVVIITGSANGLGKALAKEFYRQGCHLALLDIDIDGLQKIKSNIENKTQRITIHKTDISKEKEIEVTLQEIIEQHKRIDVLVNNAGISISRPFDQVDLVNYKQLFEINFWGTVYCSKYFLPELKKQPGSRLVNIISDFALMGFPGKTAYSSSKSAIMGFTNSLKTELINTTVTVSLVIPPPLNTELIKSSRHIGEIKREKEVNFIKKNSMHIEKAARRIITGIKKGKYRIVVGPMMFWIDLASRFFPTTIHNIIGHNKKLIDFV